MEKEIFDMWRRFYREMKKDFMKTNPDMIVTHELRAGWSIAASQLVRATIENQKFPETP